MTQRPDAQQHDGRISVLIPCFNYARYLGEAIESVLRQTHPVFEVIVVDDGSTDDPGAVVAQFGARVRLLHTAHGGIAKARNQAVEAATGDLIAFLDADDRWMQTKLALQIAALTAEPTPDLVFGHVRQFHSPDLDEAQRQMLVCPPDAQPGTHAGTMLVRAATFRRVGPFSSHWKAGEFLDWYARASELGLRSRMLAEVVMERRLHGSNTISQQVNVAQDYAKVLGAALQRRRAAQAHRPAGNSEIDETT